MEDPPPSTRACVYHRTRPFRCLCGTVDQPHDAMPFVMRAKPAGMWMSGCRSGPPASSRVTVVSGSSESRGRHDATGRTGADDDVVRHRCASGSAGVPPTGDNRSPSEDATAVSGDSATDRRTVEDARVRPDGEGGGFDGNAPRIGGAAAAQAMRAWVAGSKNTALSRRKARGTVSPARIAASGLVRATTSRPPRWVTT